MTGWDVLDEARTMLRTAVARVPADGWERPTPCDAWNVAQVLQHAALDQEVWAAALGTGQALDASAQAWTAIGDAAQVPTPLPQGAMAPGDAAAAAALDAAIHAWDIAMAAGQSSPLRAELARSLTPVAKNIVEPLRAYGAYARALETEPGADDEAVLLSYLGRRPHWTA